MENPHIHLRTFLRGVLTGEEGLRALPVRDHAEPKQILDDLVRYVGLCVVPVPENEDTYAHYPLITGVVKNLGPVIIRMQPSLLNEEKFYAISLITGRVFNWNRAEVPKLVDPKILLELFDTNGIPTAKQMNKFAYAPVRSYLRQTLVFTGLASLLNSALFIVNFTVLLHAAPAGATEAFATLALLMALIILVMIFAQWIITSARLFVDSLVQERQQILALSLMFSLSPKILQKHGPSRVIDMTKMLADTAKTYFEAALVATSLLALAPVLVLLYFRLPTGLFVFILVLGSASISLQVLSQLKFRKQKQEITLREAETRDTLFSLISHAGRVKFYSQEKFYLNRWQIEETHHVRDNYGVAKSENSTNVILEWISKIAQMSGLLTITLLVATATNNQQSFDVANAYMIIHLITSLYGFSPRIAELLIKIGSMKIDLASSQPLLDDIARSSKASSAGVRTSKVSVEFEDFQLPYGCQFEDSDTLSIELSGPKVIQIFGESGSGKSTFLRCLLGIEEPASGRVNIMQCSAGKLSVIERQKLFAYVSQNVQLVPGSLRDNLLLFAPPDMNDREIWEVLQRVGLYDHVRSLPLGLDTPIVDARRGFSTGERQRIILAQALMKKSEILVLDEAMSGLPKAFELEIFEKIRELFCQVYFVSHRQHMLSVADSRISLSSKKFLSDV